MCSKPNFARAGKGGSVCSKPQKKCVDKKGDTFGGQTVPLPGCGAYHTILLFRAPDQKPQVCVASAHAALPSDRSTHRPPLCRVFVTGQVYHYEWQQDQNLYRTTLLPLTDKMGKVSEVVSVTKNISDWGEETHSAHRLREGGAPKTFAQLLLAARENEKREVAKALHDEIGTAGVMLSALVSIAKQSVKKGDTKQALQDLERLQLQTQNSIERLRSIIVTLRPPALDTDGALRGSLEELIGEVCRLGQLTYQFECDKRMREKGISDRVKILLYRVVQEALSNVVKHARATQVSICLKRQQDELLLDVKDNGKGFVKRKQSPLGHMGLRSMQDSVRLLGGTLTISSTPGAGTHIKAVCPCVVYEDNI